MNNKIYNAIIFVVSIIAFLILVHWSAPWWAYLLYFIILCETN